MCWHSKENQGRLYEDVTLLFDDLEASGFSAYEHDDEKTVNKNHGRLEVRQCWTISDPEILQHLRGATDWKKLTTVVKVRAERKVGEQKSVRDRYYLSSLDGNAQSVNLLKLERTAKIGMWWSHRTGHFLAT